MKPITKLLLAVALVLGAGLAQAAPVSQGPASQAPAIQPHSGVSVVQAAESFFARLADQLLEALGISAEKIDRSASEVPVIEKPKAEGVAGQG